MQSVLSSVERPNGDAGLHVDLKAFEAPMISALHRAAIFLGYAYHMSKIPPLASVSLNAAVELNVGVPDPIAPSNRKAYQVEFASWSIGQALVEVDQSYHRFISTALDTISRIDAFLANGWLPDEGKPKFANTWTVHEKFHSSVDQKSAHSHLESDCLRSLGNARNCLVHDSGIVTKWRVADDDTMPVKWIGRDMIQLTENGERRVLPRDRPFRVCQADFGKQLVVEEVSREMRFNIGERVTFNQSDLSEIIFFYQYLAMLAGAAMHGLVQKRLGRKFPKSLDS